MKLPRIIKRLVPFWPLGIILLLWGAFGSPYFIKGLVPFPSKYLVTFFAPWNSTYAMPVKNAAMPDIISQIYPWKHLVIGAWKSGHIPLWNPYAFAGTPLAANYQSSAFSPVNIMFLVLPFLTAWSLTVLSQPLIAATGMYVLLRLQSRSRVASVIGALGFMFCGFIVTWMGYGTLSLTAAFMPWCLVGVACIYASRVWAIPVTALLVATSLLSGHFQIALYVAGVTAVYCLVMWHRTRDRRLLIMSLASVACGFLLAAPQLLITADTYAVSTRSSSFVKGEVIPWNYIVTLFAPDYYGNPVTRNDWFGHYAEWASYIGIIPLLLAVLAFAGFVRRDGRRLFILLAVAGFLFAYPTPLTDLLFALRLPVISTSAASRIMVVFSFALAGLAAFGYDDLVGIWLRRDYRRLFFFIAGAGLIAAAAAAPVFLLHALPADKLAIARRNVLLPVSLAAALSVVAFGAMRIRSPWFRAIAAGSLVLITAFDMFRYAVKWMPFEPAGYVFPSMGIITRLSAVGVDRVVGNIGGEVGNMYNVPLVDGYDAMYIGRYGEFMNLVSTGTPSAGARSVVTFDRHGRYRDQAMKLLGVRYVVHKKSDGRNVWALPVWDYPPGIMTKQYEDDFYELYEYHDAYPRAFLASSYVKQTDPRTIASTLFSEGFPLRDSVVLETDPAIMPASGSGTVRIDSYGAGRIVFTTTSDVPKLLFLSDSWDRGWKAAVDGRATPVMRADYAFRAVSVPSGAHTVVMTYAPDSFTAGWGYAAAGVASLTGLTWMARKKRTA